MREIFETITNDDGTKTQLLYLTNEQALTIAENTKSIEDMLNYFCGGDSHKASLTINLAQSWGFEASVKLYPSLQKGDFKLFESVDMEDDAFSVKVQLEKFIKHVILPLAEKTNAIIFCNAVDDNCILTKSLMEVLRTEWSGYRGNPLFTIIRLLGSTDVLYMKENIDGEKLVWPKIKGQSSNWTCRHKEYLDEYFKDILKTDSQRMNHDLSFSKGHLIIIE